MTIFTCISLSQAHAFEKPWLIIPVCPAQIVKAIELRVILLLNSLYGEQKATLIS